MATVAACPNGFTTIKQDALGIEFNGGYFGVLGFVGALRIKGPKSVTPLRRLEMKRQLQVCASADTAVSAPPIRRST